MMLFALAPAIAPVIGGFIATWFGWRAIFVFIALLTATIFVSTWMLLPETLPKSRRQGLRPRDLLGAYYGFLVSAGFWRLGGALAANFQGFFLFILAAPVLLTVHLKLAPTEYAWLFVPATAGTVLGGFIASRSAGRKSLDWAIRTGYLIMGVAAACNLLLNLHGTAQLPWAVLPIMLYTTGDGHCRFLPAGPPAGPGAGSHGDGLVLPGFCPERGQRTVGGRACSAAVGLDAADGAGHGHPAGTRRPSLRAACAGKRSGYHRAGLIAYPLTTLPGHRHGRRGTPHEELPRRPAARPLAGVAGRADAGGRQPAR
jgi:MFS family permease